MTTRREVLRIGTAAFGLSLAGLLRANPARRKARSVVILYLSGGPSQLDSFDLKPDAPAEIRGSFRPINTAVPGVRICEHFPRTAKVADKIAVVRSMSHLDTNHVTATYWAMTGAKIARPVVQSSSLSRNDRPHVGAVVAKELGPLSKVPPFVTVPEFVSPVGPARPGQHAGFLGPKFDPYLISSDPNEAGYSPGAVLRQPSLTDERVSARRGLLDGLDRDSHVSIPADLDAYRVKAFDLIASPEAQRAFDLSRESAATRDRYTRTTFGQSALVARRLVEAGVRVVQVTFVRHDRGKGGQGYDSHASPGNPPHLQWCKDTLFPPTDAAFASLVEDLSDRGLLDETLVLMLGEFGRTPRFNTSGGRDHWSRCYSAVLAGGGIRGGQVYGASDAIAAEPLRDPVSPDDLYATVYDLLGVDRHRLLEDLQGRPLPICEGTPVKGLV
jgi:hypothetical protein